MTKTKIYYNKPVHLGMCILDLSKTLMYDFHYNYIMYKYGSEAKLLLFFCCALWRVDVFSFSCRVLVVFSGFH